MKRSMMQAYIKGSGEGNEDAVNQAYETLKEGCKILFPLGPCEFSPLCADFIDKFGIRWCLFI